MSFKCDKSQHNLRHRPPRDSLGLEEQRKGSHYPVTRVADPSAGQCSIDAWVCHHVTEVCRRETLAGAGACWTASLTAAAPSSCWSTRPLSSPCQAPHRRQQQLLLQLQPHHNHRLLRRQQVPLQPLPLQQKERRRPALLRSLQQRPSRRCQRLRRRRCWLLQQNKRQLWQRWRLHWGGWCEQRRQGVGRKPRAAPYQKRTRRQRLRQKQQAAWASRTSKFRRERRAQMCPHPLAPLLRHSHRRLQQVARQPQQMVTGRGQPRQGRGHRRHRRPQQQMLLQQQTIRRGQLWQMYPRQRCPAGHKGKGRAGPDGGSGR